MCVLLCLVPVHTQGLTASQQAPASLLVSYLAYNQPELEQASGASISYLALKLLQALQATVARPVQRSALVLSLSALVPRGSGTEAALKELFRWGAAGGAVMLAVLATAPAGKVTC